MLVGNEETMESLKKKKLQRVWLLLCMLLVGILIPNLLCEAADRGMIRIEYRGRTEQDKEIVLDGAEFICYFVGSSHESQWKLTKTFANIGISLEDEKFSQRALQAEKLYEYAKKNGIQGTTVTTDSQGIAQITDLKGGLYLIAQTKNWEKSEVGKFFSAPFLLEIPVRIDEKESWKVVCKPKSEWVSDEEQEQSQPEPEENEKPDQPKTGDSKPVEILWIVVGISLCLAVFIGKKKYDNHLK